MDLTVRLFLTLEIRDQYNLQTNVQSLHLVYGPHLFEGKLLNIFIVEQVVEQDQLMDTVHQISCIPLPPYFFLK